MNKKLKFEESFGDDIKVLIGNKLITYLSARDIIKHCPKEQLKEIALNKLVSKHHEAFNKVEEIENAK